MVVEATYQQYGSCAVSSTRLGDGVVCVSVAGELDLYTLPLLERELAQEAGLIAVDLADCDFVDSTTLGALVAARRRLEAAGGDLALVAPGRSVRRALELTGLDGFFVIHDSRTSALTVAVDV